GQKGIISGAKFHTQTAGIKPASAKILLNENNVISDVLFDASRVYFRAGDALGNAQIAVYDAAGEVLWSWHIWRTDAPGDVKYTNRDNISWTVMDRNLGAISADPADGEKTYGLYYQWGRKDPFPREVISKGMYTNKEGTIEYAVKHPRQAFKPLSWTDVYDAFDWCNVNKNTTNHHLWGNPDFAYCHPLKEMKKTIYDPCPAGYVVAPSNAFIDFEVPERLEFGENGFEFAADNGIKCFFPFAGGIYTGVKLDRPNMPVGECCALWNSASARFIYWDDGGSRSVVYKDSHEARNYYGDTRACCYPVRCVRQAE
ncbi:MAG: hypothetical protein IKX71_09290, partial [Bacteroidales bacterium]|nr:hypothetical protein [Bacteroidales bacterium]